jgi:hypothetical protein
VELFDEIVKFPFKHPSNKSYLPIQSDNEAIERLKLWMAETGSGRIKIVTAP